MHSIEFESFNLCDAEFVGTSYISKGVVTYKFIFVPKFDNVDGNIQILTNEFDAIVKYQKMVIEKSEEIQKIMFREEEIDY